MAGCRGWTSLPRIVRSLPYRGSGLTPSTSPSSGPGSAFLGRWYRGSNCRRRDLLEARLVARALGAHQAVPPVEVEGDVAVAVLVVHLVVGRGHEPAAQRMGRGAPGEKLEPS